MPVSLAIVEWSLVDLHHYIASKTQNKTYIQRSTSPSLLSHNLTELPLIMSRGLRLEVLTMSKSCDSKRISSETLLFGGARE